MTSQRHALSTQAQVAIQNDATWLTRNLPQFLPIADTHNPDCEATQTAFAELCLLVFLAKRVTTNSLPRSAVTALGFTRRYVALVGQMREQLEFYENLPIAAFPALVLYCLANEQAPPSLLKRVGLLWKFVESGELRLSAVRQIEFHYLWRQLTNVPISRAVIDTAWIRLDELLLADRFERPAIYELTHLTFFLTDFGALEIKRPQRLGTRLAKPLGRLLTERIAADDRDLVAELLLTAISVNHIGIWTETAWTYLAETSPADRSAGFLFQYHTPVVTLLAACSFVSGFRQSSSLSN